MNGCLHDEDSTLWAIRGNSLECLRCLIDELSLAYSNRTFISALLRGNIEQVKYLIDQDCPYIYTVCPTDEEEDLKCDLYFLKNNKMFVESVEYAVDHGWDATEHLKRYVMKYDITNCA